MGASMDPTGTAGSFKGGQSRPSKENTHVEQVLAE
jgi:hypothetical protein